MNSPFLTYKYPHFLPSSREVELVRDGSWKGQNCPCSSFWIVGFVSDWPVTLCPFFLVAWLFQSWLLHTCSQFGKDDMKKARFHVSSVWEMEKCNELTFFDLQIPPHPPIFKRGGRSERPELAGSKMALPFFPDCWNSEKSEMWVHNLSGRSARWIFVHVWIWG